MAGLSIKTVEDGELEKELENTFSGWEIDSISFDKSNSNKVFKIKLNIKKEINDNQMVMISVYCVLTKTKSF